MTDNPRLPAPPGKVAIYVDVHRPPGSRPRAHRPPRPVPAAAEPGGRDVTGEVTALLAKIASQDGRGVAAARPAPDTTFARNPLADQIRASNPVLAELAAADAPAPTLFAGGDLPSFTASGVDPKVLTELPWQLRHAAAAEPDRGQVLAMVQNPDEALSLGGGNHPGNDEYSGRIAQWKAGTLPRVAAGGVAASTAPISAARRADLDDELYDSLFPDEVVAREAATQRLLEVTAADAAEATRKQVLATRRSVPPRGGV